MKKNHIKTLLILLLLPFTLLASTYEWKASIDKKSAYVNEAIYLKYSCEFSDRGELYVIDFNPVVQNDKITIKLLSETTRVVDSKRISSYEFIAFIHKSGAHSFDFEMVMKETSEDSIMNGVLGRDNEKNQEYEEFTHTFLKQKVLKIEIKESNNSITADLDIKVIQNNETVKAYEPYHLEILLKGVANFDNISALTFDIPGVKVFTSKPSQNIKLTKEGYLGIWSQKFAFVATKNFEIPSFNFSYLDLKTASIINHTFEAITVEVIEGYTKEELLDADEEFVINYEYLYYILSFIAGFLIAKIKFKKAKKLSSKEREFIQKIEKSKNIDEILFTLILSDSKKYRDIIRKIESKELQSIKEVKRLLDI